MFDKNEEKDNLPAPNLPANPSFNVDKKENYPATNIPPPTKPIVETNTPKNNKTRNSKKIAIIGGVIVFVFTMMIVSFLSYNAGKKSATTKVASNEKKEERIDFVIEGNPQKSTPTPEQNEISPTAEPIPKTITKIVSGEPSLDGHVSSNGVISDVSEIIRVGRDRNTVIRGFVSFNLSELPGGITIRAANLRIYQTQTINAPYTTSGDIRIDHISYGNTLDSKDYSLPALLNNIATLSMSKRIGWKEVDVTALVRDDIANARSSSQFRIHFSKELTGGDELGDFAYFISSDSKASVNKPQLVVEYY